jgi:transcriptional regulator with XRE-family HTH domain
MTLRYFRKSRNFPGMTTQEITALKKKFGKHLQKVRTAKGMTLADVEAGCTLEASRISKIEQGKFNISLSTIMELAKGLEVPASKLLDF